MWSPQESVLQCLELALGVSSFCNPEPDCPQSKSRSLSSSCYFFPCHNLTALLEINNSWGCLFKTHILQPYYHSDSFQRLFPCMGFALCCEQP